MSQEGMPIEPWNQKVLPPELILNYQFPSGWIRLWGLSSYLWVKRKNTFELLAASIVFVLRSNNLVLIGYIRALPKPEKGTNWCTRYVYWRNDSGPFPAWKCLLTPFEAHGGFA